MRFWTRFKLKLKKGFKRFIKRLFFTKDEWLRFKKTESYQMLRTIMIDRYFYKDITKNSYATVMPLEDVEKLVSEREKYQKASGGSDYRSDRKKGVYDEAMVKAYNMNDVERIQLQSNIHGIENLRAFRYKRICTEHWTAN